MITIICQEKNGSVGRVFLFFNSKFTFLVVIFSADSVFILRELLVASVKLVPLMSDHQFMFFCKYLEKVKKSLVGRWF